MHVGGRHNLGETRSRRPGQLFERSRRPRNRLSVFDVTNVDLGLSSRFPMAGVLVSKHRNTLFTFFRARGRGRARVGCSRAPGGFRARRGFSRAPGGFRARRGDAAAGLFELRRPSLCRESEAQCGAVLSLTYIALGGLCKRYRRIFPSNSRRDYSPSSTAVFRFIERRGFCVLWPH